MVIRNDATIETTGAYSDYLIPIRMVTHPFSEQRLHALHFHGELSRGVYEENKSNVNK